MKAKVYLTHNCEAHKEHLGYDEHKACCDREDMVADYEMELVDAGNNRIEFNVPPSGMEGIDATITKWREKYGAIETEYIK